MFECRIDIIAERHEEIIRRLYTGFDPEPFHIGLRYNWQPPNPKEFTVNIKADVKRLLEFLRSQPPPQLLPQRLPVQPPQQLSCFQDDNKHGQHKTRSTTHYTVDGFSLTDDTRSSEQAGILYFQADIGVNPETIGNNYFTSKRLPGVRKIANKMATTRDGIERRSKQAS